MTPLDPQEKERLIDALHAFLAPGVTTWTMTSADLVRLAAWLASVRTGA